MNDVNDMFTLGRSDCHVDEAAGAQDQARRAQPVEAEIVDDQQACLNTGGGGGISTPASSSKGVPSPTHESSNIPLNMVSAINAPMFAALESHNITHDRLAEKLDVLLDAKEKKRPLYTVQLKALEIGLNLHGAYPAQKASQSFGDVHIQVINYGEPKKIEE